MFQIQKKNNSLLKNNKPNLETNTFNTNKKHINKQQN